MRSVSPGRRALASPKPTSKAISKWAGSWIWTFIPKLNEKDFPELPDEVRSKITFILTEDVDEVLATSLEKSETKTHIQEIVHEEAIAAQSAAPS